MSFFDNIGKKFSQGIDRAKWEAEKFQRTTNLQNELTELRKQFDARRLEFGDRALELFKAGKIQSPTLAEIHRGLDLLQRQLTLKEEELKTTQAETFVEPAAAPSTQQVPISVAPPTPAAPPAAAPTADTKFCHHCGFRMPATAVFCPNCGNRTTA